MRTTFFAAGLLALLALPAAAQQGRGMGGMGPPQSGRGMFAGITLSEDQQQQVTAIWESYAPVRQLMHAQMQGGAMMRDPELHAQMMGMRKAHQGHFRTVLTPEQQVVFDRNVAGMGEMGRGQGRMAGPCGGGRAS